MMQLARWWRQLRTLQLVALALVAALACPAFGWEEPDKFRGVPWGATLEEARALLKAAGDECSDLSPKGRCYVHRAKIGPVSPVSILFTFGKSNAFEHATLSFPASQYAAVRAILVDRYGTATRTKEETLQNRFGTKFTNEIVEWSGERVYIRLRRNGSELDKGSAIIGLKAALQREGEDREKALKKGKDDL